MSGKLHLICMKTEGFHAKIRCNLNLNLILIITTSSLFILIQYF